VGRKSRIAQQGERSVVLAIINAQTKGVTREDIRAAFARREGRTIAHSTLAVRLEELLATGRISRSAARRNTVYSSGPATANGSKPVSSDVELGNSLALPLSADALAARILLRRPRGERAPVTYNPEFLDAYQPGTTWYLPRALRDQLSEMGRTDYMQQAAGTYARDIMQRLIIDLSWGSSRLEGNKYSRIDTEELLRGGTEAPGASAQDRQMILNHKAAIEFLVENAEAIGFNRYTMLGLHALLSENLLPNPDDEGKLRARPIVIGTSVYTPTAIPQVIEERFDAILTKASAIPDPMEQAFFAMVHLPYLQPFIDVNKRTSRLAANIPLITANLCPLSFVDVPEQHYNDGTLAVFERTDISLLRDVFAWAYERSCAQFTVLQQAMGEPDPIRLNYRVHLRALVSDVVRGGEWPTDAELATSAERLAVPEHDREAFAIAARRDLVGLRPDILARYSLRQSEFETWVKGVAAWRQHER